MIFIVEEAKETIFDVPEGTVKVKNFTEVSFLSNVTDDSNDETNFSNKLLLTDRQVLRFRKAFLNDLSTNIKLSKTQISKMVKLGGLLALNPREFVKVMEEGRSYVKSELVEEKIILNQKKLLNSFKYMT